MGIQQILCLLTASENRLLLVQYSKWHTLILLFIEVAAGGGPVFFPVYFVLLFFQFTKRDIFFVGWVLGSTFHFTLNMPR